MKTIMATPKSKEPYYPTLLSNGQDGILVDYSGSSFVSSSGHTHYEQSLGAATGWYKGTSRAETGRPISLIMSSGIQVVLFKGLAEPNYYEQTMDCENGILTTILTFAKRVRLEVESFITDDGLWCERVKVLRCPKSWDLKLGYATIPGYSGYAWMDLTVNPGMQHPEIKDNELTFGYQILSKSGKCGMWTNRSFHETDLARNRITKEICKCIVMFEEFGEGEVLSRVMTCVDETETENLQDEFANRKQRAQMGYEALKEDYVKNKTANTKSAQVSLPNPQVQRVYDMGRYVVQSCQNRKSGALCLGLLPHLWGGGLYCSYDAHFTLNALLTSGYTQNIQPYKEFIYRQGEIGRQALKGLGMEGASFTGWTDCLGNFTRKGMDLGVWLLKEKPMFAAFEILNIYKIWCYTGKQTDEKLKMLLEDYALFAEKNLLQKRGNRYYMISITAGTEAEFEVETDTFTIVPLGQAFIKIGEMLKQPRYVEIGESLLESLRENCTKDGYLLPFKGAKYLAGGQMDYYLFSLPKGDAFDGLDGIKNVDKILKIGKTPWGYQFDVPTEVYRTWPWYDGRAVLCYAYAGQSEKAMRHILNLPNSASSMGILPEKVRLDGLGINYWYTSPMALAVWAVNTAFAYTKGENLYLCQGFTKRWQTFSCENIHVENGLRISVSIADGKLKKLVIENIHKQAQTFNLLLNDEFTAENLPKTCTVEGKSQFVFERG